MESSKNNFHILELNVPNKDYDLGQWKGQRKMRTCGLKVHHESEGSIPINECVIYVLIKQAQKQAIGDWS